MMCRKVCWRLSIQSVFVFLFVFALVFLFCFCNWKVMSWGWWCVARCDDPLSIQSGRRLTLTNPSDPFWRARPALTHLDDEAFLLSLSIHSLSLMVNMVNMMDIEAGKIVNMKKWQAHTPLTLSQTINSALLPSQWWGFLTLSDLFHSLTLTFLLS